jgi:hypothetical protein
MDGLKDLKSQAYDILANIQMMQNRLNEINNLIYNYKMPEIKKDEIKENLNDKQSK